MAYTGQLTGSVVGRDPELKYFENGNIVANFTISARQYKRKGEEQSPRYVRVAVWGKTAEYVGNYVKRGDSVLVTGRVETPETYVSQKDGQTKVNEKISADQIEKFTPREDQAAAPQAAASAPTTEGCPMPPPALTVQQQNVAAFQAAQAAQQQRQQQPAPQADEIPF